MGSLFIGVVLLFPKGLVGSLRDLARRFKLNSGGKSYVPTNEPGTTIEVETAS
jgi:hypothetical protein